MKKIILPLISLLILILLSCNKKEPEDNIKEYQGLIAIVGYDFDVFSPTLNTKIGLLTAPQLDKYFHSNLKTSDVLFCEYIIINEDNQPREGYTLVWDLFFYLLDKVKLQATDGGERTSDDFWAPIDDVAAYDMFGNVAVMWLYHTAPGFQQYDYEMTYDPEEEVEITTVYIRAKEREKDNNTITSIRRWCAFDLNDFIKEKKGSENKLEINIKFKIGEKDGEDIYKDWDKNPIELKID